MRQHCRDNVTMFSVQNMVDYCILTLLYLLWLLYLNTEAYRTHFSYFFFTLKIYYVVAKLKKWNMPSSV